MDRCGTSTRRTMLAAVAVGVTLALIACGGQPSLERGPELPLDANFESFRGGIDEVRVYGGVLSDTNIEEIYGPLLGP